MKVNILGIEYEILYKNESEEPFLKGCDGFMDQSRKEIIIDSTIGNKPEGKALDGDYYRKQVLRHEITHAYFYESGLWVNSGDWNGRSEELTDWFAIQSPKLLKTFQEVGCI